MAINKKEIDEKLLKLVERRDNILKNSKDYAENKEEFLLLFEKFINLEKKLLIEKWWKLIEKDEELKEYIKKLDEVKEILWDDLYNQFITLS